MSSSRPLLTSLHPSKIMNAAGTPVHPSLLANQSTATPPSHYPYQDMYRQNINADLGTELIPPQRKIFTISQVEQWLQSEAFIRLGWFLTEVNRACHKTTISHANKHIHIQEYPGVHQIVDMLKQVDSWITEIPAEPQRNRFGNMAYRVFIGKLESELDTLLDFVFEIKNKSALLQNTRAELKVYLAESFGNGVRLDYGSGHELSFVVWLMALELIGYFEANSSTTSQHHPSIFMGIGLVIMPVYLDLVRRLQQTYTLEPAGSHGVWGLDDFQFVPFYWGASQLIDHPHLKPTAVMDREVVGHFSSDYLYLSCINYIYQSKQGPFFEHSPMLYDISGVGSWAKVNSGLLKMYTAEVLSKFPIVQHLKFGSLFPFRPVNEIGTLT